MRSGEFCASNDYLIGELLDDSKYFVTQLGSIYQLKRHQWVKTGQAVTDKNGKLYNHLKYRGRNLLSLREGELRGIRGAQIALIAQDPASALNPVIAIGDQIGEVIHAHFQLSSSERKARRPLGCSSRGCRANIWRTPSENRFGIATFVCA